MKCRTVRTPASRDFGGNTAMALGNKYTSVPETQVIKCDQNEALSSFQQLQEYDMSASPPAYTGRLFYEYKCCSHNKDEKYNVTFYTECDYQGKGVVAGSGQISNVEIAGIKNDSIRSVKIPKGTRVVLYEHPGFQGRSVTLTEDTKCLTNFLDMTSSVIIY